MAEPKKSKAQKAAAKRGMPTTLKKANLGKGSVRAGKGKGTTAQRKGQNIGVADGTIRLGRSGKTYNVYDAKTGTWKKGVVKTTTTPSKPKPKGEPPGRTQKAAANKKESQNMRMGYQYGTKYGKPANPYSNQGASVKNPGAGQPKAIRPSGGPTRYARFSNKNK